MAAQFPIPNFAPLKILYLLLLSSPVSPFNITNLLSGHPDFSDFNSLLSTTSLAADLAARSSLTLLVVPNLYLHTADSRLSSTTLPDVLRYHVLLEYLSLADLRRIPPSGKLVATLLQTTGRAPDNSGSVNITFDAASSAVAFHSPSSNATLISPIETLPYNISVLSLNSLLIPVNLDLMASETRPPLGLNITKALIDGHSFNVAASMLAASGVVSEFEDAETGAGITLFAPTDSAFADLPSSIKLQSLPADKKAVVLRFHVFHSYYPLGTLQSIVNPIYPTLATEQNGAGQFTVNISRVNGSVALDTGVVQATITQTVFDQKPVSIFGVSKVLLPKEYFGSNPIDSGGGGGEDFPPAQPPEIAQSPTNSPGIYGPPSHLSSPPGLQRGPATAVGKSLRAYLGWLCIGLYYHLLH